MELKKLKLKSDTPDGEAAATEGAAATAATDAPPGLEPAAAGVARRKSGAANTIFGILALVTLVCCLAVIGMQVSEYLYYGQPQSVWLTP